MARMRSGGMIEARTEKRCGMILVTLAAALLFWGRDNLVLRIGPTRRVPRRVWMYSAVVFIMAMLLGTLTFSFGPYGFRALLHSPQVFISLIAFHLGAGITCFWLKQTERYDIAWLAAMIPAPGVWFLLAKATFLPAYGLGPFATSLIVGLVSALWITLMVVTVPQMGRREMPVPGELPVYGTITGVSRSCKDTE